MVRFPLVVALLGLCLSVPVACVWAQNSGGPAKATGAPLQLLAPLPSPVPSQLGPTLPATAAPVARPSVAPPATTPSAVIVTAPPSSVPAPAAPVVAATAPPAVPAAAAPSAVDLPLPTTPEPVTADLFGVKPAPQPAPDSKPAVAAAVAVPAATVEKPAAPKPTADVAPRKLTVIVAGDSIADGIWGGLYRKLLRDKRYEIVRKARNSSGFVAFDWVEELQGTEEFKRADAVIFLAGTNDRQSLVRDGKPRFLFGTKQWEEAYLERVTALMQSVKQHKVPLVWIGLPIARKDEFNKDSRYLNGLFSQAAAQAGVHFIDIWPMFADKDGQYSAYLPDEEGRNRLMRDNDGIHFTPRGYEMIADAVLEKLQKTVPAFQQAAMTDPASKAGKSN